MPDAAERRDPCGVLDASDEASARAALFCCCGSRRWVEGMLARRPYGSNDGLRSAAHDAFAALERADLLEAFAAHPAVGADPGALRERFRATATWSSEEQAGVAEAGDALLHELAEKNRAYRERFGYVFLICATGKSALDMLSALRARLGNPPDAELALAAAEQLQITLLRLDKLAR